MKFPLVSLNFLEEISSLSYCVVFLYFFALIAEEGFLISSWYSLELCIQMLISFLYKKSILGRKSSDSQKGLGYVVTPQNISYCELECIHRHIYVLYASVITKNNMFLSNT